MPTLLVWKGLKFIVWERVNNKLDLSLKAMNTPKQLHATKLHQSMIRTSLLADEYFYEVFTTQSRLFTTLKKKPFENFEGNGENAGNQHFLLFPQCFLSFCQWDIKSTYKASQV